MASLLIPDVDETTLAHLCERALAHGRTPEAEARLILLEALQAPATAVWAGVDAIYQRLQATGQSFSDSAELLREDRDR